MKIAISTDGDHVSPHFGRCPAFTVADIKNGEILKKEVLTNPGHHPGYLPEFLKKNGVDCIIAGGMGMKARELFHSYGIETLLGIDGEVDQIIREFSQGTLKDRGSSCQPGAGKGYGLDKTNGHCKE